MPAEQHGLTFSALHVVEMGTSVSGSSCGMLPHRVGCASGPGRVFCAGSAKALAFQGPLPTRLSNPPAGTAAACSTEVGCCLLTVQ